MEISLPRSILFLLKPTFHFIITLLVSAYLLAGCSPAADSQIGTAPPIDLPTHSVSPSSPTLATPTHTLPSPTQSETIIDDTTTCRRQGTPGPLPDGPFDAYPQAIQQFLNEGGWVEDLDEALYAAEIANLPVPVGAADMTGDGFDELVVSIYDPGSVSMPPAGMLIIYTCSQGKYRQIYLQDSRPLDGAPGIRFLQDLNADGLSELVISSASCGAHTCFERVQVIGWEGAQFTNRLGGETNDLPYPTIYLAPSANEGIFDLQITGSGLGSVGAGPQRNITKIWSYAEGSQNWQMVSSQPEPSNYRIHVLHDAGAAAKDSDFQKALSLYNRAISDTTLDDWLNPALEQAWIGAFSRYHLVVIYTMQERDAFAEIILGEMEKIYPLDSPQHGYYEMAVIYRDGYLEAGAESGCAAAIAYAASHPDILEPLGSQTFGYGNPTITPADICP
jgi:hypothetical protein